MKYRIIICNDTRYPYRLEEKTDGIFSSWNSNSIHSSFEDAEKRMKEIRELYHRTPVGTVLKEYDESDFIIDKLKGE
jgi:hypothetical protein